MHSLATLLLTVAAACATARPGPSIPPEASRVHDNGAPPSTYLNDFILPHLIMPRYFGLEESPRVMVDQREIQHDWLDKEIDRISEMAEVEEALRPYEMDMTQWIPPMPYRNTFGYRPRVGEGQKKYTPSLIQSTIDAVYNENKLKEMGRDSKQNTTSRKTESLQEQNKSFALTPLDEGYFDETGVNIEPQQASELHEGGGSIAVELQLPRQIRQNPNLSKSRTLVSENIDQMRSALANKDYSRLPVSLLPTNLRWLNINQRKDDESQLEGPEGSSKPGQGQVQVSEATDPADSIYGVAIITAVGSSLAIAIVGFAFGWYTLSKKAKAAADVDYPAYGVTGPTIDSSGDRRLAHSAHMYHYQHQKQQIIAMERNGMDHGTGSVSDPESEEENEEGDYTVYECPGFASTGDIEVQNPLFSEDPTPATPGKCEIVKPQPKE